MKWRTDKPTADNIVAKLTNHSYEVLHRESGYYFDFVEDNVPLDNIEKWADLEEDETSLTPEQAMSSLDEKIKSAKKSWEGVDADEYLDEVRGRDETVTDCYQLEEEVKKYINDNWEYGYPPENVPLCLYVFSNKDVLDAARHFAKWGAEHLKN